MALEYGRRRACRSWNCQWWRGVGWWDGQLGDQRQGLCEIHGGGSGGELCLWRLPVLRRPKTGRVDWDPVLPCPNISTAAHPAAQLKRVTAVHSPLHLMPSAALLVSTLLPRIESTLGYITEPASPTPAFSSEQPARLIGSSALIGGP